MNTILFQKNNYQTRREKDCHIEKICSDFVDKYYLDKCIAKYSSLGYERVTDINSQFKGEDLLLKKDGNVIARVDEKAKIYKCIGEVINWPSFEITFLNRAGERSAGWFANPENTTTHYAIISIASSKDVEPGREWELEEADISRMVYAFVNAEKLKQWVHSETGRTIDAIVRDADKMVADYEECPCSELLRKYYNKYIHLTYSPSMREKPVNLVIRRDMMRLYRLMMEVYIDRNDYKHYEAPIGILNPEKLYRQ